MKTQNPASFLSEVALQVNSLFYTFTGKTNENSIDIQEVYKVGQDQPIITGHVGSWNLKDGLQLSDTVMWERRKDLGGLKLSTASEHASA